MGEPTWVTEVLHFWFVKLGEDQWFAGSEDVDSQVRDHFLSLHESIVGHAGSVESAQRPILAAVIVLDQFSRHLFRGASRAFAADPIARRLSRAAVTKGLDAGMNEQERLFLYMPFEHSEDREDQALAVELIARLGHEQWTRAAIAHKAIVDRFGRFPHRNALLNRRSSAEELALLQKPETWY